ncbi:MAG: LCP family protein [Candidatus Spechtbacterales bacterium]
MFLNNFTPDHSVKNDNRGRKKLILMGVIFVVLLGVSFFVYQASNVLTIAGSAEGVGVYKDFKVDEEKNRLDILILGIRGAGDPNGGLLADTIVLLSIDKEKKKVAMVSLPRDLYVEMPDHPRPEKINFAYALGEQRKPGEGGLTLSKEVIKYVTGVYVDHAVVINHAGFERIIDIMGGVTVYRDTPFYETQQWQGEGRAGSPYWYKEIVKQETEVSEPSPTSQDKVEAGGQKTPQNDEAAMEQGESEEIEDEGAVAEETTEAPPQEYWVFRVPAGTSTLYGKDALYYVRSRYSSSDFDRARRQQQVLESLKEKAFSLGVLGNPVRIFDIMDTVGKNIRTDMGLGDIRETVSLAQEYAQVSIEGGVLDTSEESILRADSVNGSYVLLPKSGDFTEVRNYFRNIFGE